MDKKGQAVLPVIIGILILGGLGFAQSADAVITPVVTANAPQCDPMAFSIDSDELGTLPGFAAELDELITAFVIAPGPPSCFPNDIPAEPDLRINMTNTVVPPRSFFNVHYVADLETTITNFDGFVNGAEAFRIDSPASFGGCGINCPLVAESISANGIFEPGETWTFILQDYTNTLALPPSALGSIGVPTGPGPDGSSGSIVEFVFDLDPVGGTSIPVDTTALLVAGATTTATWMIPVIVAAVGFGLLFTLKKNH